MTARDRWWLLFLAGLLVFHFHGTWLTPLTYFARDVLYVFQPMHAFSAENLQAGRLPLWNPYVAGGVYWMGDPQTGLFYPGNLLFFLFPFVQGYKIFQAAHFLLTAWGAYLLARSLGGRRPLCAALAAVWSLNGFWLSRVEFPSLLGTITWLPWLLLLGGRPGRYGAGLFGAALALSFFAGHTPHFLWVALLAGLWVFCRQGARAGVRFLAWAGAVAAGLTAVQWAPTLDAAAGAERFAEGVGFGAASAHALRPAELWGWVWPAFSAMKERAYSGEKYFWLGSFYLGAVGAALAVAGLFFSRGRQRWLWAGVAATGAVLCLGDGTPFYQFLYDRLFFFRWIRYPGQFAFWMVGAGLVLAAMALPGLGRRLPRGARVGIALAAALELLWVGWRFAPALPGDFFHERPGWERTLQEDGGRLFLTPRAQAATSATGASLEESWRTLRRRLLNLGPAPYHIRGLNPHGTAFVPRAASKWIDRIHGAKGLEDAAPFLQRLDVRWVASPAPLDRPGLIQAGDHPWFIYRLPESVDPGLPLRREPRPGRVLLNRAPAVAGRMKTVEFAVPGWEAYGAGRRLSLEPEDGLFTVDAPASATVVRLLFRPTSFRRGATGTLFALFALLGAVFIGFFSRGPAGLRTPAGRTFPPRGGGG